MFNRIALAALLAFIPVAAGANQVVNPHVFVDGETLVAANLNAPLQVLFTLVNGNIDHTNIGTAGIFASQIEGSTTASATFGGSIGYIFQAPNSGVVPLTVEGANLQAEDLFDVVPYGASSKLFSVDYSGDIVAVGAVGSQGTYVTPLYQPTGGGFGNTAHSVQGSCQISGASTCTVTLSGAAAFSNAASWACSTTVVSAAVPTYSYIISGGTQFVVAFNDGQTRTATVNYVCTGT